MGTLGPSQAELADQLASQIEHTFEIVVPEAEPAWRPLFEGVHESSEDARRDSEVFRHRFFLGDQISPILQLPTVAVEKMDIVLLVTPRLRIDGASAIIRGVPFVFVSPRFSPRMLFTLGHEIGHLVAHHRSGTSFAVFDGHNSTGSIRRRRFAGERFADAFASALLLPISGVGITLGKVREIYGIDPESPVGDIELLYLARFFGVSFQVAARRCEDLQLIPEGGALSLYEEIRKRHDSPENRAEHLGLPPRPEIKFPTVPRRLLDAVAKRIRTGDVFHRAGISRPRALNSRSH